MLLVFWRRKRCISLCRPNELTNATVLCFHIYKCQRIGALPIKEITATEIRLLFNEISGKSQSYINKYCMTINSVFAAALNDHIILSNPMS